MLDGEALIHSESFDLATLTAKDLSKTRVQTQI